MHTRVEKTVPIFEYSNPGPEPDCQLERTEARRVVQNGDGEYINHGKALRLRRGLRAPIQAGGAGCGRDSAAIIRKETSEAEWMAYGR
jgi:hypothetical protein